MVRFFDEAILYAKFNIPQSISAGSVLGAGIDDGYDQVDLQVRERPYVEFKRWRRDIGLPAHRVDSGKQVDLIVFECYRLRIVGQERRSGKCGGCESSD